MQYEEIINEDGTLDVSYRRINPNGKLSDRVYDNFEYCYWDYAKPFYFPKDLKPE